MAYSLIACDYDLTLTRSDRKVSPHTRDTIRAVFDAGKYVTLASGRLGESAEVAKPLFPADVPLILGNGAAVQSSATGEMLAEATMDAENALTLLRWCRRIGSAAIVYARSGIYTDRVNLATEIYAERSSSTPRRMESPEDVAQNGVYKILLLGLAARITAANRKLHTAPPCPLDCFTSGAGQLEIVAPGVNKGAGLARAAALLGIPQEETIAIGDGENDIAMLRWAGLGIAMENAPDNVKAAADVIAPVCDLDGAAWAMENYLLK